MNKWKDRLDPKYAKVCVYACGSVVLTAIVLALLYLSGGFWSRLWALFLAVLRPIVVGGIFCYLLTPLATRLEKLLGGKKSGKWARPLAVILSFLIVFAVIAALLVLVLLTMYRSVASLNLSTVTELFKSVEVEISGFLKTVTDKAAEAGLSVDRIGQIAASFLGGIRNLASGLLFGVIFAIYFMLDGTNIRQYWSRAFHLLAGEKADALFRQLASDADRVFSGYLRGQFVDALVVGVLSSFALMIAGVPSAVMIGVFTGLGNLIPYVGPIVGYLTLALVCIPNAAWGKLFAGAVILAVVMLVDSNLINPRLLSSNIKIHPLLVVAALIGGGAIGGFVGMIVAVPTAALLKLQFDRYLDRKAKSIPQKNGS